MAEAASEHAHQQEGLNRPIASRVLSSENNAVMVLGARPSPHTVFSEGRSRKLCLLSLDEQTRRAVLQAQIALDMFIRVTTCGISYGKCTTANKEQMASIGLKQ
jgi:hypothetical protein